MIVDWRRQTLCKVGFYIECVLLVAKFFTHIFYKYQKKKTNTEKCEKNRFSTFVCNKWVDKLWIGCKIACLFNGDFHNTSEFCRKQCFSIEYGFRCILLFKPVHNALLFAHVRWPRHFSWKKISRKKSIKNVYKLKSNKNEQQMSWSAFCTFVNLLYTKIV